MFAMEAEAAPLIAHLGLTPDKSIGDPRLPFRYFSGNFRGLDLLVSENGKDPRYRVDNIGTEPAVLNTYVTIERFRPGLVINAGTAGGFIKHGGQIGDVYLGDPDYRFHDHRIQIPGFLEYGIGAYPSVVPAGLAIAAGLKTGVISTGNALDATPRDLEMLEANGARAKDMEAAAIAWVCWTMKVPFFALKSITDRVDGPHATPDEFLANLSRASQTLTEKLEAVLEFISKPETRD